jgi:hypothetical protein
MSNWTARKARRSRRPLDAPEYRADEPTFDADTLAHHGVKGQKKGVRQYQYLDGSLTPLGREHYGVGKGRKETQEPSPDKPFSAEMQKKYHLLEANPSKDQAFDNCRDMIDGGATHDEVRKYLQENGLGEEDHLTLAEEACKLPKKETDFAKEFLSDEHSQERVNHIYDMWKKDGTLYALSHGGINKNLRAALKTTDEAKQTEILAAYGKKDSEFYKMADELAFNTQLQCFENQMNNYTQFDNLQDFIADDAQAVLRAIKYKETPTNIALMSRIIDTERLDHDRFRDLWTELHGH